MEINGILEKVKKAILDAAPHEKDAEKCDLEINVMMVGGRRCGKTSVLAAMQSCADRCFDGTPLMFGPMFESNNATAMDVLEEKLDEMKRYFRGRMQNPEFSPDLRPSDDLSVYPFYVRLKDKKSYIKINFIDYKGEWLGKNQNVDLLKQYMAKSRILIIAIDTPHLMEAKGIYNEVVNRCRRVTEMVKGTGFADAKNGPGLVLFVPLKCERYYNHNEMYEVTARVQKEYAPLIHHLQQPGADGKVSQITIAMTPILTLGGAEFSYFQRDDNYDILLDEDGSPKETVYHIPDLNKTDPEPLYCEQPLLYVLSHTFALAEEARRGNGLQTIVNWLQSNLLKWSSAEDYLKQAQMVGKRLKRDGSGYCILNKGVLRL